MKRKSTIQRERRLEELRRRETWGHPDYAKPVPLPLEDWQMVDGEAWDAMVGTPLDWQTRAALNKWVNFRDSHQASMRPKASEWQQRESKRKSDPEAKRARKDPKFQGTWLRAMKAERRRHLTVRVASPKGLIQATDQHHGHAFCLSAGTPSPYGLARVAEIDRLLKVAGIAPPAGTPVRTYVAAGAYQNLAIVQPYSTQSEAWVEALRKRFRGIPLSMRGKDWSVTGGWFWNLEDCAGETTWKNDRPVGYSRATHSRQVRSVAMLRRDGALDYVLHTAIIRLPAIGTALDGTCWAIDDKGLKIVFRGMQWRPSPWWLMQSMDMLVDETKARRLKFMSSEANVAAPAAAPVLQAA